MIQANALRHALTRHPDGSSLVAHAAAGDKDALRLVKRILEDTLAAVLRHESIQAARTGGPMPTSSRELPLQETVQRLRVALSALSDVPWVISVVRGVVIVRPPAKRAAQYLEDGTALATAFGVPLEKAEVLIPPEGRVAFVAQVEANALKVMERRDEGQPKRSTRENERSEEAMAIASKVAGGGGKSRRSKGQGMHVIVGDQPGEKDRIFVVFDGKNGAAEIAAESILRKGGFSRHHQRLVAWKGPEAHAAVQRAQEAYDAQNAPTEVATHPDLTTLLARILGDAHEPLDFRAIVKKVKRSGQKHTPGVILATLDAMKRQGYVRTLPGDLFATGTW